MSAFDDDDVLMDRLGEAIIEHEQVPDAMRRFAVESHRLLSFEAELADIVADSSAEAAAVRSAGDVRFVQLGVRDAVVSLEITASGALGSATPHPLGEVVIETAEGKGSPVAVNERGFFSFEVPTMAFRLWLSFDDFEARTPWIR